MPATGNFSLAFSSDSQQVRIIPAPGFDPGEVARMELLDVDGRMVFRAEGWTDRMPVSGYMPGLRIVRIVMADGRMLSKGLVHP